MYIYTIIDSSTGKSFSPTENQKFSFLEEFLLLLKIQPRKLEPAPRKYLFPENFYKTL